MLPASHRGRLVWRMFKDQSGYSLPEVMVAILILAIAIIPMVGMFDAGLRAATLGGNYDKARALANKQMEIAKSMSYENARDNFPEPSSSTPDPGTGVYTSGGRTDVNFPGFTYVVRKTYMNGNLNPDPDSKTRMEIDITVSWGSNSYITTGLMTLGTP